MIDLDLTKSLLDRTDTTQDTFLSALLTAAWDWSEQYCGRKLRESTVTESWLGEGNTSITLQEYPVTGIASITVDGATLDAYVSVNATIALTAQTFTSNKKCAVVYVAGYPSNAIPADLQFAVCKLAAHWFTTRKQGNKTSANVAGESISYHDDRVPWSVKDSLNAYKRVS